MLYLIPTPIGNLDDISVRAMKLLQSLSVFACEDTRTFKKLLNHYQIDMSDKATVPLTSYTDHAQLLQIMQMADMGDVGVVSEAGTPGLSDPAKELIKLCREHDCAFEVLPGANALVPAVVGSPCDTTRFQYYGFLPTKKGRTAAIAEIILSQYPVFIYESVHRIEVLLDDLEQGGFGGTIGVFRELSKMFEQKVTGDIAHIRQLIAEKTLVLKGEFVIGIYPPITTKSKRNKYAQFSQH